MADIIKGLFGGAKPSASPVPSADADFADFAGPPAPSPVSVVAPVAASPSKKPWFQWGPDKPALATTMSTRPYTKWYNIHERVTLADFYAELVILPFILLVVLVNVWGTRTNRRKAKAWLDAHMPALSSEFAVVGFGSKEPGAKEELLKEKSKDVYASYATGRQNVAFVDIKLSLYKRYNPLALLGDVVLGFFIDSMPAPSEKVELTAYAFDGLEGQVVPRMQGQEVEKKGRGSTYDGFVWAVVHKDNMKRLRDDRYDLSLTSTKDHPKLPVWATVMSESAEITEALLTADLVKAIEACGEDLESLIVTDMPVDAPTTLNELIPKKRLSLNFRLRDASNTSPSSLPLFAAFLRLPDHLVNTAHFRPEVMRRVKTTREEETKKLRKVDDEEKAEERKLAQDKAKKDLRDKKLKGLSADEQRKFLEKEREKQNRKATGRKTMKA